MRIILIIWASVRDMNTKKFMKSHTTCHDIISMTCDMNNLYCGILARNNASILLRSMAYYYSLLEGSHGCISLTRRPSTHPGSTLHIQPFE